MIGRAEIVHIYRLGKTNLYYYWSLESLKAISFTYRFLLLRECRLLVDPGEGLKLEKRVVPMQDGTLSALIAKVAP
jgi:hypothetical protein